MEKEPEMMSLVWNVGELPFGRIWNFCSILCNDIRNVLLFLVRSHWNYKLMYKTLFIYIYLRLAFVRITTNANSNWALFSSSEQYAHWVSCWVELLNFWFSGRYASPQPLNFISGSANVYDNAPITGEFFCFADHQKCMTSLMKDTKLDRNEKSILRKLPLRSNMECIISCINSRHCQSSFYEESSGRQKTPWLSAPNASAKPP